jgi:hypothetical protein
LTAYGYKVPREPRDLPVKLPIDIFKSAFVNWGKSTIRGAGLEFVSVRVIPPAIARKMQNQLPSPPNSPPARVRIGRPSARSDINAAIMSLYQDGTLPNELPHKSNMSVVKDRIHKLFPGRYPKDKGLGYDTLRKQLTANSRR